MKRTILSTLILLSVSTTFAVERRVPGQYPTIQAAIDNCNDGDVVIISPGTYRGAGNREIDLDGKAVTVRSIDPDNFRVINRTVIDCQIAGRGFIFRTGEDANSEIAGLTIINGHSIAGGAMYCCSRSSPAISNCVIVSNSAVFGGGIACYEGSYAKISNCTISSNSASMGGGAFYCNASGPSLSNCVFSDNVAPAGGAISCADSNLVIGNCTLGNNTASKGGGIYCYKSSNVTLENSILWGNTGENGPEILVSGSGDVSSLAVLYSDVYGGKSAAVVEKGCSLNWGDGNLDAEPMFVAGLLGDYYLDPNSPCVDAGSEFAADLGLEEFGTGADGLSESGIVDMGYHYHVEQDIAAATVDIKPDVLDLDSRAEWITCYIELPEDRNVADVDPNSVVLEYLVEAERIWANELRGVVTAEFSRSKMGDMLEPGDVTLTVSGELAEGNIFEGTDVIRVID